MNGILWIDKNDEVALLKKHHEAHNLAVLMYDQLVEILDEESPIYEGLNNTHYDINEDHKSTEEMRTGKMHVLDWLHLNGMNAELVEAQTKHIVRALTADITYFLHESLNAAKKRQTISSICATP